MRKAMQLRDVCTKQCALSTSGLIVATISLVFAMFWQEIFSYRLAKEMAVRPDSRSYVSWKSPPFDLYLDIYFFNWTNPDDFKTPGTKPILEQLGPYRFKEKRDKVDIKWHPENSTVSYRQKSIYYFDEEGSNGTLSDNITSLNAVALAAAANAKDWSIVSQLTVSTGLTIYGQRISVTKTASEFLFEGYSEDMITIAKDYPIFGEDVKVPFDKAGWFYTRNNSADLTGHYNIFTGEEDIFKIGQMHTWNYEQTTKAFQSYCGMINGSAGEFYPPHLLMNESISMFTPDMCRSIKFDFVETKIIEGIEGYKFSGTKKSVENGTIYPENKCFCTNDNCAPSGVFDISACRYGAPIFMSYPHFFNADQYYVNQVVGLSPSEDKHEFYMILEPTTGIPLEVAARFQLNMLVEEYPNIELYRGSPKIYFPVIWFEQKVTINEPLADDLKLVLLMPTIGHICAGVLFSIGLILIFWFPVDKIIRRKNKIFKSETKQPPKKDVEIIEKSPEGSPLLKTNNITNVVFSNSNNLK